MHGQETMYFHADTLQIYFSHIQIQFSYPWSQIIVHGYKSSELTMWKRRDGRDNIIFFQKIIFCPISFLLPSAQNNTIDAFLDDEFVSTMKGGLTVSPCLLVQLACVKL